MNPLSLTILCKYIHNTDIHIVTTHRQMDEIALNRFNEEELQCIFEYEQIMEMLLKEEALTRHLTEKSKN